MAKNKLEPKIEKTFPQKTFTTNPKLRRIRKGHTIVIERCKEIMEHLWQRNFRTTATKKDIETSVFFCAGGDYRTIKKYLGFDVIARGKGGDSGRIVRRILGYLQRLRFIDKLGNGKYHLNHNCVPLNYHYQECFPPLPPSREPGNSVSSKQVLCVRSSGMDVSGNKHAIGAIAPTTKNNKQQHNTHTKSFQRLDTKPYPLNELEKAILRVSEREGVGHG